MAVWRKGAVLDCISALRGWVWQSCGCRRALEMATCGISPQTVRPRAESTSQYFTTCSISARESRVEWKAPRSILQHVFWRGNRDAVESNCTSLYFTCVLARESWVEWKARRSILQHVVFRRGNREFPESTSQYFTCISARESWVEWKAPVSYTHLTLPTRMVV